MGFGWASSGFPHTLPTLHPPCMGLGWPFFGLWVGIVRLSPHFANPSPPLHGIRVAFLWALGGHRQAFPTLCQPFPLCMGLGWTFFGPRVGIVWLSPHFGHPSPPLHGIRVDFLWAKSGHRLAFPTLWPPFTPLAWD